MSGTIVTWLELARTAKEAGNDSEAIQYFNKILDTVSKETAITDLVIFNSLRQSENEWSKVVLNNLFYDYQIHDFILFLHH